MENSIGNTGLAEIMDLHMTWKGFKIEKPDGLDSDAERASVKAELQLGLHGLI